MVLVIVLRFESHHHTFIYRWCIKIKEKGKKKRKQKKLVRVFEGTYFNRFSLRPVKIQKINKKNVLVFESHLHHQHVSMNHRY